MECVHIQPRYPDDRIDDGFGRGWRIWLGYSRAHDNYYVSMPRILYLRAFICPAGKLENGSANLLVHHSQEKCLQRALQFSFILWSRMIQLRCLPRSSCRLKLDQRQIGFLRPQRRHVRCLIALALYIWLMQPSSSLQSFLLHSQYQK